jgi:hypothetical protein
VGHRKSLEEVFLYFSKNDVKYSLLPAGLFKPNLYFELINHARNENIVLLREGGENERISHTAFLDLFSIACWFIQA